MPGDVDPLYVAARRVLFDALQALERHRDALVLVGAHAVYTHAEDATLAVAPFTTDGDLAIDPRLLAAQPLIEEALSRAAFHAVTNSVGQWELIIDLDGRSQAFSIDLMVPQTLAGSGRRAARIPPHAKSVARIASGLEPALVDRDQRLIRSLDSNDPRVFELAVAGPSALIVAKVHKILDRADARDRLRDKDALDIYRLLKSVPLDDLVARFARLLESGVARGASENALRSMPELFGSNSSPGIKMLRRALGGFDRDGVESASAVALSRELVDAIGR